MYSVSLKEELHCDGEWFVKVLTPLQTEIRNVPHTSRYFDLAGWNDVKWAAYDSGIHSAS